MEIDYRNKILNVAAGMFRQFGLISVSMDDLAHELHISKKSIYEEYSSKSDIVITLASKFFEAHRIQLEKSCDLENAASEFIDITKYSLDLLNTFNPKILFDIQKSYPEVWTMFHEYKNTVILEKVKSNLKKGIKEGYYREEINVDVSSKIFIEQLQLAFDSLTFPKHEYNSWQLLRVMMKNQFHSIAKPEIAQAYIEFF